LGFKFNVATNNFFSSGQIPLDVVTAGELDHFGFVDPSDEGRVRLGTAAGYYRKEFSSGDSLKADVFLGRSLFDLDSNFTFFLNDPLRGDGIQQPIPGIRKESTLNICTSTMSWVRVPC